MLFSLVKKDFILGKNYLLILLVFAIVGPIYMTTAIKFSSGGFMNFFPTALLIEFMLIGTVSMAEDKYKGATLLCTTPYTRNSLVKARYIFILIIFFCNYIIYTITAFIAPIGIPKLNVFTFGISLLFLIVFFGIGMTIEYKFGYEKTKYVSMCVIMLIFFVVPSIAKWLISNNIGFKISIPFSTIIQNLFPYVLALVIGVISMNLSIRIYSKKNL